MTEGWPESIARLERGLRAVAAAIGPDTSGRMEVAMAGSETVTAKPGLSGQKPEIDGLRNRIIYEVCCLRPFLRRKDGAIPAGGLAAALDAYDALGHEYAPRPHIPTPQERAGTPGCHWNAKETADLIVADRRDILARAKLLRSVGYDIESDSACIAYGDLAALLEGR